MLHANRVSYVEAPATFTQKRIDICIYNWIPNDDDGNGTFLIRAKTKREKKKRKEKIKVTDLMVFGLTATIHSQSDSLSVPLA